jgi:predicted TIM-barrel fold metal-dependent hydrolase
MDPHKRSRKTVSRRQFHAQVIGLAAALSATEGPVAKSSDSRHSPGRYVDIHTHLGQAWNTTEPLTAEGLLRWMDANQIGQAVVLPLVSPEASSYLSPPEFVLAETARHRDRLIPFCAIDPRTAYQGGKKGALAMLKKYQDAGAKGFGEHKPGVRIDDPKNLILFEACGETGLPVLFHLDEIRNIDEPGLPGLERVLKQCTETIFIGHGPGWWASISGAVTPADLGGYPRGVVVPGGAIDRLMDTYSNLYGDLSAGSGAGAIQRDPQFGREFLIRRADRLMFGTDYLSPGQDVPQLELYARLDLPDDVQAKIFRDNARRLLGLV